MPIGGVSKVVDGFGLRQVFSSHRTWAASAHADMEFFAANVVE